MSRNKEVLKKNAWVRGMKIMETDASREEMEGGEKAKLAIANIFFFFEPGSLVNALCI